MRSALNSSEECTKLLSSLGFDHRRRKTIPLWNSSGGGGGGGGGKSSSVYHCMSGIYNIGHCVMSWYFSNCEQGSGTCLFLYTQLQNAFYEREAGRTDSYWPQEMATQARQASRRHYL